jgi:hypothetical protein
MLTAKRAFPGEDVTDTIVAIVSKEPDWSALPDDVPEVVRLTTRGCLEKDARKRMPDGWPSSRLKFNVVLNWHQELKQRVSSK